jgi:hypothetical protein
MLEWAGFFVVFVIALSFFNHQRIHVLKHVRTKRKNKKKKERKN